MHKDRVRRILPGVHTPAAHGESPLAAATLLDVLRWRGLLYDCTDGLRAALATGQISGYCGFDPSAASLHVGNLVAIMALVHLQQAGHRPVILVGGGTGMIGDPSGKSTERQLMPAEVINANAEAIGAQLARFLDFSGPRAALVRNNATWLLPLGAIEFLREVGKHFSVNYMLAKDSVKTRLESGISFTEFAYMLLQADDFLELHRRDGVTLQVGGSDQWGNITAGIELIRRTTGRKRMRSPFRCSRPQQGRNSGRRRPAPCGSTRRSHRPTGSISSGSTPTIATSSAI